MKTVSTAFKDAQKTPASVSVRRVSYKRRYWVEASKAYTWEAAWTVLPENEIVSVSPITGKLDTDKLNEFKISNVNLVLKNERRQWKAGKRGGYFGVTDTYPNGFEPYWTKFKIESGYEVSGVATYVPLFVGVATGFSTSAASDTIQVEVQGLEALLINANAENVSTLVTLESMGTGNGSNKDFTTVQPGVGIIKEVSLNGIAKKMGTDYSISQLNEPTLGAKISFTTAPGSGVAVKITYRYWKQDVTMESLVKDLLTEAGIPSGNQNVDAVFLSQGVITQQIETTQADFNAGTYNKTEGSTTPGSIKLNYQNTELLDSFADGDFTSNPAWTNIYSWTVESNKAKSTTQEMALYTNCTRGYGEWKITFSNISATPCHLEFFFICNTVDANNNAYRKLQDGYSMEYHYDGGGSDTYIQLWYSHTSVGTTYKDLVGYFHAANINPSTFEIVRQPSGLLEIFRNGTKLYSGSGYTHFPTSTYVGVLSHGSGYFTDVYIPTSSISGQHTSRAINLGFPATSYGNLVPTYTLNAGTITFESRTSSDGSSWNSWLPVNFSISSTPLQYIQIRSTFTSLSPSTSSPVLDQYDFIYTSSSTTIKMANFTGDTVYSAIQKIGSFANYEWGFDESEDFFFRSKSVVVGNSEQFDSSTNLIDVSNVEDGIDRVYSEVKATYGEYSVTVGDDGFTKDGPVAKYGKRTLTIDGGDLLIAPDKDVATGVAGGFYSALKYPRMSMKAKTKLMEWLDLSDTVSLTFNDNIPARPWFFGDTSAYFGDTSLYFFGDADQTAKGMLCKVVGYRHDTENKISEFDLEEILQ